MDEFSTTNIPGHESTPPAQPVPRDHSRIEQREQGTSSNSGDGNDDLRVKLAWAKLLWLMLFLAVLLSITYLVPYVIEETQYSARRGRLRAEHELAKEELKGSPLAQLSFASQLVTQNVTPSVVHISARTRFADSGPSATMMGMRNSLFSQPPPGQGSGVIVNGERGFVMTNYHVVKDALEIKVRLAEGKPLRASVIGYDIDSDLAILQILPEEMPNDGLTAAEWGDSESLEVGSLVWAMGSPSGLELSVTKSATRSSTSCRLTRRSTQAIAADRSWTFMARSSALIRPSSARISRGSALPFRARWRGTSTSESWRTRIMRCAAAFWESCPWK
jgi:hypothetical protein